MIGETFTLREENKADVSRIINNIQGELPSLYNFLIADRFLEKVKKMKKIDVSIKKRRFFIDFYGIKESVKFEENTLSDFQISLSGLHDCDAFATCDRAQAQLIKLLHPEHKDKIRFYESRIIDKMYKEIDPTQL